MSFWELIIA